LTMSSQGYLVLTRMQVALVLFGVLHVGKAGSAFPITMAAIMSRNVFWVA
jgi:hypothetical protein